MNMKLIKLEDITGEEILAKSVVTEGFIELLSEGTKLSQVYVQKLRELGVKEVFVHDDRASAETIEILKQDLTNKCREQVKSIISKHTYNHNENSMIEISKTADNIIAGILSEENVIEQVFDIRERSADIYEHSINTCSMAMLVALKMRLKHSLVHDIAVGCLLHDIGMRYITVPYENIDAEKLDDKDREEYRKHPVYGYSALKSENWLNKESKEIILCHHERLDGSGFPLHAKDLSIGVKIVSLCDFFDEAICGICMERMKVHEVVEFIKVNSGILFDTSVVSELLDFTAVYPSKSVVITNGGECAVVIKQNKGFPERPVLQLLSDKYGKNYEEAIIVDLLECKNIFIEKVID